MKFATVKPVFFTSIISFSLIAVCILLLYCFKNNLFRWTDPTAELRNVSLGILAIGGIPFLILGHLTKRKDVEAKQQDLMFRTETIQMENILDKLRAASIEIKQLFRINFSMQDYDFNTRDSSNILDFFGLFWQKTETISPSSIDNAKNSLFFEFNSFTKLNKEITVICHCLRLKGSLKNLELKKMISIDLITSLQEDDLTNLLYVTSLREFGHIEGTKNNLSDTKLILEEITELRDQKLVSQFLPENSKKIPQALINVEGLLKGREK